MSYDSDIAAVAALMADPGRAAMLNVLLDGRALPAGELSRIAGVSAQTGSAHLAKLVDGGLLTVRAQGRHRYYTLANATVAHAIETLCLIAPVPQVRSLRQSIQAQQLAAARTCYDHLAGVLAVSIADALVERGDCIREDTGFEVTPQGIAFFRSLGIEAPRYTRTCIDWTQRRQHISGTLGRALLHFLLDRAYVRRGERRRTIIITPTGSRELAKIFECDDLAAVRVQKTSD